MAKLCAVFKVHSCKGKLIKFGIRSSVDTKDSFSHTYSAHMESRASLEALFDMKFSSLYDQIKCSFSSLFITVVAV